MKVIIAFLSILLVSLSANCQTTSYGLWYNSSNGTHHLAAVDMTFGQMTIIDNSNNVGIVTSETAVINPTTNQYIFEGRHPSSSVDRYFAIDLNSGALISDTLAPNDIRMLQIHPSTDSVYGLWYNSSNGTHHLASVDMFTGQMTIIDNSNNVGIVTSGTAVINPTTNQYIFEGRHPSSSIDRYFAIDLNSGALISDTLAPNDMRMLQIHPSTDSVYGLWYNSSNGTHHLASIDMFTGQMTIIDNSNNVGIVTSETAVINPITNQYVFEGRNPSSSIDRYFAIDLNLGTMINDTLAPNDIRMLKYYSSTLNLVEKEEQIADIRIYPNPFNQFLYIDLKSSKPLYYSLNIVDVESKILRNLHGSGTEIFLNDLDDLVPGFYIINLQIDQGYMFRRKLIKE